MGVGGDAHIADRWGCRLGELAGRPEYIEAEVDGPVFVDTAVVAVQTQARELLAATREVVVKFMPAEAITGKDGFPLPAPTRRSRTRFADAEQPWTCLAAATMAAGLLLEVRHAHAYVARPVASLLLAAPLALM